LNEKGIILVITAPSGSGKTTIYRELLNKRSELSFSVSCTTRKKRADERDGVDYHFISRELFEKKIKSGNFIEWAQVHGDLYGTEKELFFECLHNRNVCILDLDVQGALNIMKTFPDAVTVFIQPPSMEELKSRLLRRGTEDREKIKIRLENAEKELEKKDCFHYIVVNDKVENAVKKLEAIIAHELCKRR